MYGKCINPKTRVFLLKVWHRFVLSGWASGESGAALHVLPAEPLGALRGPAGWGAVKLIFPLTEPVVDFLFTFEAKTFSP